MMPLNMDALQETFDRATELGMKYVGVVIQLPDTNGIEVIINDSNNFKAKKEYYKNAYFDDLQHASVDDLKIVGFTFGNSFQDIEDYLLA